MGYAKAMAMFGVALFAAMVLALPLSNAAQSATLAQNFKTSAIISATSNGYNISNITLINPFSFTLNGSSFSVHISYINHNSTGLVINNSVYALYLNNGPVSIRNTSTHDFYAKLVNVSYYSKQQSVAVLFYSINRPNQPILNNTYNLKLGVPLTINVSKGLSVTLESNQSAALVNLDVSNVTNAIILPNKYTPIMLLNVSVLSLPVMPISVSLSASYNCSLDSSKIEPFKLYSNGTWEMISNASINASNCTVSFDIPPDPIVALFYGNFTPVSTSALTTASTIVPTTIPATTKGNPNAIIYVVIIIVIVIILIVADLALNGRKRKREKNANPSTEDTVAK